MIGDTSGCLEVIAECDDIQNDIEEILRNYAQTEWNIYLNNSGSCGSRIIKDYYDLSQQESDIFEQGGTMPDSFVAKFANNRRALYKYIRQSNTLLWHKKNPDTFYSLMYAFMHRNLLKIKCNICGREFFIDPDSFHRVKWKSCIRSECLKFSVNSDPINYSNNLYKWNTNVNALQEINPQLSRASELSTPFAYYSEFRNTAPSLNFAYISDIHLDHHLEYYNDNEDVMVRNIVYKLFSDIEKQNINFVIFIGDTASSTRLTTKFYRYFMHLQDIIYFKKFRSDLICMRSKKIYLNSYYQNRNSDTKDEHKIYFQKKLDNLTNYINKLIKKYSKDFDYINFKNYRLQYYPNNTLENAFEHYTLTPTYKELKLSLEKEAGFSEIIHLENTVTRYKNKLLNLDTDSYIADLEKEISRFENKYSKPLEEISINDYMHHYLDNIYVVLGNHEFIDFPDIKSGVSYYENALSSIGIHLLHNNYILGENYVIYGGTGFAKYDSKWNATSLICCPNFTRDDENKETTLFEENYYQALELAKTNGLCFICVSHYPTHSCLNKNDKEAIYFTGHTHHNILLKNSNQILYADNQIGYKSNNITFKFATTGLETNPYADLEDGLFLTSIDDYLHFYRYIGENIGDGNLLYQRYLNGKTNLYVVKRFNYYGFFMIRYNGSSKGISILNGGKTKKISESTDINWICENFEIVLLKYLHLLLPLRNRQEHLSQELKELGLNGNIHGCIVDIDYYHHIMVDPLNGSIAFYYSSCFGYMRELKSFDEVIESLEDNQNDFYQYNISQLREDYKKKSEQTEYLLSLHSNQKLIDTGKPTFLSKDQQEYLVSRSDGAYGVSAKINPLQRLFSGHVLRAFDIRLTETKGTPYRTYLYTGQCFFYNGVAYKITDDDGTDIINAKEIKNWNLSRRKNFKPSLTRKVKSFSLLELKKAFSADSNSHWIK